MRLEDRSCDLLVLIDWCNRAGTRQLTQGEIAALLRASRQWVVGRVKSFIKAGYLARAKWRRRTVVTPEGLKAIAEYCRADLWQDLDFEKRAREIVAEWRPSELRTTEAAKLFGISADEFRSCAKRAGITPKVERVRTGWGFCTIHKYSATDVACIKRRLQAEERRLPPDLDGKMPPDRPPSVQDLVAKHAKFIASHNREAQQRADERVRTLVEGARRMIEDAAARRAWRRSSR